MKTQTDKQTLKKGDRVIVRNTTLGGESVIEGNATIVALYPSQSRYRVRFDGDPNITTRQLETVAEEYGRRCADAMNAHDVSLYNILKSQFNARKASASFTAGTGAAADEMNSQFNASYRANRVI